LKNPLPEGALYLRCERVKVLDTPAVVANGKVVRPANKEMEGHVNVLVQGREVTAHADTVTYNQLKQQIILYGTKEAPAKMIRQRIVGGPWETATGTKIIYNRSEGKTIVEGTNDVQGETSGGGKKK